MLDLPCCFLTVWLRSYKWIAAPCRGASQGHRDVFRMSQGCSTALTGVWGNLTDLQLTAWTSRIRRGEEKGLRMSDAGWEQCQLWSTSLCVSMWGWQRAKQHSEKKCVGLQNFTGSSVVPLQSKEMCSSPQSMASLYDGCLDTGADWSQLTWWCTPWAVEVRARSIALHTLFAGRRRGTQQQQKNSDSSERILKQTKENLARGALFIFFLTFMYFKIKNDGQEMLCVMSHMSDDHFSTN